MKNQVRIGRKYNQIPMEILYARSTLISLGFFVRVKPEDYVHVRRLNEGEIDGTWAPDPEHAPGNNIVDTYPAVFVNRPENTEGILSYIGELSVLAGKDNVEEYSITSDSREVFIVNRDFNVSKLSDEEKEAFFKALKILGLGVEPEIGNISKFVPADYNEREFYSDVYSELSAIFNAETNSVQKYDSAKKEISGPRPFITNSMVERAVRRMLIRHPHYNTREQKAVKDAAEKIAGAMNARTLLLLNPRAALTYNSSTVLRMGAKGSVRIPVNTFFSNDSVLGDLRYNVKGKNHSKEYVAEECPFSREYVSAWLEECDVVGFEIHNGGERATAPGEPIFAFFDLDRVNSEAVIGRRLSVIINTFGKLPEELKNPKTPKISNSPLSVAEALVMSDCKRTLEILKNYANVDSLRPLVGEEYFTKDFEEKCKAQGLKKPFNLFDFSTGNWEGYTVGEHTEAVLRAFETTFEPSLPTEVVPIIKLALTMHDVGKGLARLNGEEQTKYNLAFCDAILGSNGLGLQDNVKDVIKFMIGEAQELTTAYYVNKQAGAKAELTEKCREILEKQFGITDPGAVQALMDMCFIIQNCDSISYSQYGVIRDSETGVYHRGGNTGFGESATTVGFERRKAVLKKPDGHSTSIIRHESDSKYQQQADALESELKKGNLTQAEYYKNMAALLTEESTSELKDKIISRVEYFSRIINLIYLLGKKLKPETQKGNISTKDYNETISKLLVLVVEELDYELSEGIITQAERDARIEELTTKFLIKENEETRDPEPANA